MRLRIPLALGIALLAAGLNAGTALGSISCSYNHSKRVVTVALSLQGEVFVERDGDSIVPYEPFTTFGCGRCRTRSTAGPAKTPRRSTPAT